VVVFGLDKTVRNFLALPAGSVHHKYTTAVVTQGWQSLLIALRSQVPR